MHIPPLPTLPFTLPSITCPTDNHHSHPFSHICLHPSCLHHQTNLLCHYCLTTSHSSHSSSTLSLHQFISQCYSIVEKAGGFDDQGKKETYGLERVLLEGLARCGNKGEMQALLGQIYKATYVVASNNRLEKVINNEVRQLKHNTLAFYQNKAQQSQNKAPSSNPLSLTSPSLTTSTQHHTPIISFTSSSSPFTLISPFQITHNRSKSLSSIIGHPSLSTFTQSIEVFVKVVRVTPNWMGVGVWVGGGGGEQQQYTQHQHNQSQQSHSSKYEQASKQHITLLANGWVNNRGNLTKQNDMRFSSSDMLSVRWNKDKKLLIFRNLTTKNQHTIKFEPQWNEDVHLSVAMFFKGDAVAVVQCGEG